MVWDIVILNSTQWNRSDFWVRHTLVCGHHPSCPTPASAHPFTSSETQTFFRCRSFCGIFGSCSQRHDRPIALAPHTRVDSCKPRASNPGFSDGIDTEEFPIVSSQMVIVNRERVRVPRIPTCSCGVTTEIQCRTTHLFLNSHFNVDDVGLRL